MDGPRTSSIILGRCDMDVIAEFGDILAKGTLDTLYMVFAATLIAYIFGLPLGIALVVTEDNHILPASHFNRALGTVVNVTRSVPFLILMIALIPFTRVIMGT